MAIKPCKGCHEPLINSKASFCKSCKEIVERRPNRFFHGRLMRTESARFFGQRIGLEEARECELDLAYLDQGILGTY